MCLFDLCHISLLLQQFRLSSLLSYLIFQQIYFFPSLKMLKYTENVAVKHSQI